MSLFRLLIQRCRVQARTTSVSAMGDAVQTYADVPGLESVRCRTSHVANDWSAQYGPVGAMATHMLYIDPAVTLDTSNRVILDDGVTYQLIHADEKHDGRGHNHAEYLLSALESPQSGA